jgi:hypothetical protein
MKMEKKIEAGAEFFQTQAVYDVNIFERFNEQPRRKLRGIKRKFLYAPGGGELNAVGGLKKPKN